MGFLNRPKKSKETVEGSNVIVEDETGKTLLNTYVSKDSCAPAQSMDKFINNALKLANKSTNTKPWCLSEFVVDPEIDKAIYSSDSAITFSDEIAPSGITTMKKRKKVEVK